MSNELVAPNQAVLGRGVPTQRGCLVEFLGVCTCPRSLNSATWFELVSAQTTSLLRQEPRDHCPPFSSTNPQ
eukprot:2126808-Prymnesium_polylepis.1